MSEIIRQPYLRALKRHQNHLSMSVMEEVILMQKLGGGANWLQLFRPKNYTVTISPKSKHVKMFYQNQKRSCQKWPIFYWFHMKWPNREIFQHYWVRKLSVVVIWMIVSIDYFALPFNWKLAACRRMTHFSLFVAPGGYFCIIL